MTEPGTRVFISHRHGQGGYAEGVHGGLVDRYIESIFFDNDRIQGGEAFERVIEEHLDVCDVLLVIIDPVWTQSRRRLEQPQDWVRREIESALQRSVPVIPILVGGADRPNAADLPAELRALALATPHPVDKNGQRHRLNQLAERISRELDLATQRRRTMAEPQPTGRDSPYWMWSGVMRMGQSAVYRLLSDVMLREHPSAARKGLLRGKEPDEIVLGARNSWLNAAAIAMVRDDPTSIPAREFVVRLEPAPDDRTQIAMRADRLLERVMRQLVSEVVATRRVEERRGQQTARSACRNG